jgi:hypothetical protein
MRCRSRKYITPGILSLGEFPACGDSHTWPVRHVSGLAPCAPQCGSAWCAADQEGGAPMVSMQSPDTGPGRGGPGVSVRLRRRTPLPDAGGLAARRPTRSGPEFVTSRSARTACRLCPHAGPARHCRQRGPRPDPISQRQRRCQARWLPGSVADDLLAGYPSHLSACRTPAGPEHDHRGIAAITVRLLCPYMGIAGYR